MESMSSRWRGERLSSDGASRRGLIVFAGMDVLVLGNDHEIGAAFSTQSCSIKIRACSPKVGEAFGSEIDGIAFDEKSFACALAGTRRQPVPAHDKTCAGPVRRSKNGLADCSTPLSRSAVNMVTGGAGIGGCPPQLVDNLLEDGRIGPRRIDPRMPERPQRAIRIDQELGPIDWFWPAGQIERHGLHDGLVVDDANRSLRLGRFIPGYQNGLRGRGATAI